MTIAIRPATPADAPALAALRYHFRAAMNDATEDRDAFLARCTPWMAARLEPGSPWHCWVAESDGAVIGTLWLYLLEKLPNPVPEPEAHAYITSIYVDPAARGGIGTALMESAIAFAREQGVDSAILWPTEGSRSLYRRFGFAETTDIMQAIITTGRDLH